MVVGYAEDIYRIVNVALSFPMGFDEVFEPIAGTVEHVLHLTSLHVHSNLEGPILLSLFLFAMASQVEDATVFHSFQSNKLNWLINHIWFP
jgi:hypothetical protein